MDWSLNIIILAIFHQRSAYYLQISQIVKKFKKLLITSFKIVISNMLFFLSSLWCSAKSTSFLRGQGRGVWGSNHTIFETFKSTIYVLSKIGTVLLFHCISKGFLFLQNWLRQCACINQLVLVVIMWFFGPCSLGINLYQWLLAFHIH